MGLTNSPYHYYQAVKLAKEIDMGDKREMENIFKC